MKILVTGGAGYIGSACLRRLLEAGHEAFAYDNLVEGHPEAVPEGRLVVGDIADTAAVADDLAGDRGRGRHALRGGDLRRRVGRRTREYHYRNNVAGTLSLLDAMRERGRRPDPLLQHLRHLRHADARCRSPRTTPQAADQPLRRTQAGRRVDDPRLRARPTAWASPCCATSTPRAPRPTASIGEDHDPETHLIPLVLQVAAGPAPTDQGLRHDYPTPDGTCIRDYIHVDDLAEAHLLAIAATTPETAEVYNIGTGKGCSVLEMIARLRKGDGNQGAPRRCGAPPGRPASAGGRSEEADRAPRLEAEVHEHRRHDRDRLALAQGEPRGLREAMRGRSLTR